MAKNNIWMSVSDLMTGLMVIFLFIAIAYMIRVRDDISEYKDTKEELYFKLKNKFPIVRLLTEQFLSILICQCVFFRLRLNSHPDSVLSHYRLN